ncbi:aldo/keto reductase [Pseudaestuariivita atlantica]|uniref:Aldo/keto reductase n=1 Tax=Pseudaestuariivita atlantica TaxID=1317121 RepID=A0A0L1JS66_9RHOB|nr:aldo/keto reductase [Pseudaestuariivita atlantica]KNG94248.1 aldo/keto reductase [Pseudaestuariivita atlantica]
MRNPLGRTGITVPPLCLGTMTFGTQTSERDAHAQIDMSIDHGVDFLDTAEMYPVNPIGAKTQGDSERVIGTWIAKTGRRNDVLIATKHSGNGMGHIRNGADITADSIPQAIDGSLDRLQTDVIDLYQLHWPNRGSYMFRQNWTYDPEGDAATIRQDMADILGALQAEVARGRIRAFGLSNESAWGTAQWLRLAEDGVGPRVASIQNEYSLLCRLYDTDLAELSMYEDVGLFCFSPLAAGLLTGKYQSGAVPEGSRMELVANLGGRKTDRAFTAVAAYLDIAERHGIDPVHLALAFAMGRPFMASAIFGTTHVDQLPRALAAMEVTLSREVLDEIDTAHRAHPMPY